MRWHHMAYVQCTASWDGTHVHITMPCVPHCHCNMHSEMAHMAYYNDTLLRGTHGILICPPEMAHMAYVHMTTVWDGTGWHIVICPPEICRTWHINMPPEMASHGRVYNVHPAMRCHHMAYVIVTCLLRWHHMAYYNVILPWDGITWQGYNDTLLRCHTWHITICLLRWHTWHITMTPSWDGTHGILQWHPPEMAHMAYYNDTLLHTWHIY